MRIVFMGTPEFAVESLKALVTANKNVCAVVTVPDKPAGRGLQTQKSDIKQYAEEIGIPILQPIKLKDEEFINELQKINADLFVVVAFRMLPEVIWQMPKMGTINLHASLLPYYRGAAPINWVIINGEKETGVTTFYINEKIDEGHILLQEKINISDTDTAATLYDKLKVLGAALTVDTLNKLSKNSIASVPQSNLLNSVKKNARKIQKDDCRIKWDKSGKEIINFIRGLSPYPCAFSELVSPNGEKSFFKIYTAEFEQCTTNNQIGAILSDGKTFLKVVCTDGLVSLLNIQMAGKVCMEVSSFLRGFQMNSKFSVSRS